ncbi:MAG: alanyl-tRNA editing protein [Gemmatimonadales bacterium]
MTDRLYYSDSYTREFQGTVIETTALRDRPTAVLDRSLFYPTSGGQPHDTGRLGSAAVIDVIARDGDQTVLHVLDAPVEPGPVAGLIDWPRRYDHMQQHTGQHILSQAFLQAAGAETVSFHLGAETVSIDLATASLPDERIADAESLANRIVAGNLAIRAWFPSDSELSGLTLRKQPDVAGPVRLVAIGEFDLSPCGGTHVAATGEVGLIAVQRAERKKGGTRVEFLSGERARADYARKRAIVRELAAALTCAPAELKEAITRMQETLRIARRELTEYRERELDQEASRLLATAPRGSYRLVVAAWDTRPLEELKALALRLTGEPQTVALLGTTGPRCQLVFGRSESVAVDLGPAFRQALDRLGGGRGGGDRVLQGAAGPASQEALEQALAGAADSLTRAAG